MKKIIFTTLAFALVFSACKKEVEEIKPDLPDSSAYQKLFKKEITLVDESGENSVYISVECSDKQKIDSYLNSFNLKLIRENSKMPVNPKEPIPISNKLSSVNSDFTNSKANEIDYKDEMIITILDENIGDDMINYSIEVTPTNNQAELSYYDGTYDVTQNTITFKKYDDFLGLILHPTYGYNRQLEAKFEYRNYWYNTPFWSWHAHPTLSSEWGLNNYHYNIHKTGSHLTKLRVRPVGNWDVSFKVVNLKSEHRGRNCQVGNYDSRNCHYGTAPFGTNAFIWGNNFYYTYSQSPFGPKCPLPGSGDDGSNCWVTNFPTSCVPFVWNNNWYVKGDLL